MYCYISHFQRPRTQNRDCGGWVGLTHESLLSEGEHQPGHQRNSTSALRGEAVWRPGGLMLILFCRPSPRDLPPDRRQLPKTSPGQSLLAPPWLTYFTSSRNNRKDQVSQTPEDHQMEKHPPSQHLPSLSSGNEALELTLICWSSLTLRSRVWTLTQEHRGTSLTSF